MCDFKNIFIHLKTSSKLNNIKEHYIFNRVKEMLPVSLKKGIKFIYIKNDTMFFVLTHSFFKLEFHKYNLLLIRNILKQLNRSKKISIPNISSIKCFVSNKIDDSKDWQRGSATKIYYKEKSKGSFKNLSRNEKIHTKLEEIRKIIKANS